MENEFPDLPTVPMPAAKPQQKRPKPWLLAVLIAGVLLLLLGVSIVSTLLRSSSSPASHAKGATSTSTALQSGQPTGTAIATATSVQATSTAIAAGKHPSTSTPTSTPITGAPSATHGRPHLGGPFSDFVGKYGTPTEQGDGSGENFWVGTDQNIDINVSRSDQGEVTQLNVLGPLSWDAQQAQSYCTQFLPDNAVQYNATSTQINYHSSSGNVVLTLQTQSCLLSISR